MKLDRGKSDRTRGGEVVKVTKIDFVQEVEKIKLEAGKYYKTADGRKVEIVATDVKGLIRPIVASVVNSGFVVFYNEEGCAVLARLNIVSEWEEPFVLDFDWSSIPYWFTSIAMDENGDWYAHQERPTKFGSYWAFKDKVRIPKEHAPKNYTGSWGPIGGGQFEKLPIPNRQSNVGAKSIARKRGFGDQR